MTASTGSTSQGDEYVTFSVADSVAIKPGESCRRSAPGGRLLECELFGSARAVVRLGDRSDRARVRGRFDEVLIDGGSGDDLLVGGPAADPASTSCSPGGTD